MEYNFSKHSVGYLNRFLDTVNEQIVDVDVALPDYCPDIEKILKCTLIPKVYTRSISGGQLIVEGESSVRILYCDSIKHCIRSFTQSVPFSATFNLKSTPEQYLVLCDTKSEYINCRALSPRKLVIHGAFSLSAKVLSKDYLSFYGYDEDTDLQVKNREITVSDLCALCQEQFSVSEDVSISSKPPIESVLTCEVASRITDLKSIHNKLMLNAELCLRVMYLSDLESAQVEHINYVIPVSRIIDCDGVTDDTVNVPLLEVMSYDLRVRNDGSSDGSSLSLDVKLCFSDYSYIQKTLSVVEDAYSIGYCTEHKRSAFTCESRHSVEEISNIVKTTVKLDGMKISKVLDVYSEGAYLSLMLSEGVPSLVGKANFCMLIEDDKGEISYIERSAEVDTKPQLSRTFDRAQLSSCNVHSISYRLLDDSTIELRLELKMSLLLCDAVSANPVVSVSCVDNKEKERCGCSLILYYADKGENTWDISKLYSTKESLLMSENSLESSIIEEPVMLFVPTQ